MTGVAAGLIIIQLFKAGKIKAFHGETVKLNDKSHEWWHYILGGIILGMGWVLTGVCSGMMLVLVGSGYTVFIVFIGTAMLGTFAYGYFRKVLPH